MSRGWAIPRTTEVLDELRSASRDFEIIAIVVDKNFPEDDLYAGLSAGVARYPAAVWVVRGTDKRAREALADLGVGCVEAPLNPHWKVAGVTDAGESVSCDVRQLMRDC